MLCPGCKAEVDLHSEICGGCGERYLELYEKRAWKAKSAPERRAADRRPAEHRSPSRTHPAVWLGIALLTAAALAAFLRPAALPLSPAALTMPGQGFAFVPPSGWAIETEAGRLRLSRGSAAIIVSRQRASAVPSAPDALASQAFDGVAVKVLSQARIEVDGRPALRLEVSGDRTPLPSPNAGRQLSANQAPAPAFESMEVRGALILLEAQSAAFTIKAYSERGDFARQAPVLQAFLENLRLL